MKLPNDILIKIENLFSDLNLKSLKSSRENLTAKYKSNDKQGKKLIVDKSEAVLYSITRMPCTYVVVSTLIKQLKSEGYLQDISSILDVGAGTGAGYLALTESFDVQDIKLLECNDNMIYVLNQLFSNVEVINYDIVHGKIDKTADLVMSSYMFNELSEENKFIAVQKMYNMANKYLLIIDAGTPKTYQSMMKIKEYAENVLGANIVAPCLNKVCPLKNDYCQFYARVERTSLLRQSKSASLSYEDEKYFYLLIKKPEVLDDCNKLLQGRVIRRPKILTNLVELVLCTSEGVITKKVSQKNKSELKQAKKIRINQIFR